jgi:hypothetical protein
LGIPIFGSDFWDPHWSEIPVSFPIPEIPVGIFVRIPLLKSHQIGIPILKFGIPRKKA